MEVKAHILIIDDDKRLRLLLEQFLSKEGFTSSSVANTAEARNILQSENIDIIILDVMMPGQNGVEFVQQLRKEQKVLPVLLLTAMDDVEDRITGLQSGADDYLTKPFEPRELCLRVENLLRRHQNFIQKKSNIVRFGTFSYHTDSHELYKDGENQDIPLSSNEQALMDMLAAALNQPVSREALSAQLNNISERSVDVQITRLRRKIEDDPKNAKYLRTMRGQGYALKGDVG